MTTETLHRTRPAGARVLLGAALAAMLAGAGAVLAGLLLDGTPAASGALVGALLVVFVLGLGTLAVDAVAGVMPSASLVVALLTYTLQVLLMGLAFWVLSRSGALGTTLDERWLAGTVIAGTAVWLVVQIRSATRARIPAFEPAFEPVFEPVREGGPGGAS